MEITACQGQTLADITVQEFGKMDAFLEFALANDMSVTDDIDGGQVLIAVDVQDYSIVKLFQTSGQLPATALTDSEEEQTTSVVYSTVLSESSNENAIIARQGQSLADVAVVEYGSMDVLLEFAIANNMSVTDDLEGGQSLEGIDVKKSLAAELFSVSDQLPATALTKEDKEIMPGGIGYMAIEIDFIVS